MKQARSYRGLSMLMLLAVGLPLAVWKFALAPTFDAHREVVRHKKTMDIIGQRHADAPVITFSASDTDLITTGLVLEKITPCAEESGARIVEYNPYVNEAVGGLKILTAQISFTGGYISILKVLDLIENGIAECEVKSVSFERSVNIKDRTTILKATIIIQQLTTS